MASKYIPPKKHNPTLLQKKFEKLERDLDTHGKNVDALSKSHDNHITMLSNFARHDIKNSVQSMDSVLSANSIEELNEEHIASLKLSLKIIRETIDNFSKLVPHSSNNTFALEQLLTAIELLNRDSFYDNKISFTKEVSDATFTFNLPFQSVLQMVNNIIINAVKAFDTTNLNVRKIKIVAEYGSESFSLKIYDNADKIPFDDKETIFEYGVSSTGGSGIGLYHAKYLCELYKGSIEAVELNKDEEFSKYFLISLPIRND